MSTTHEGPREASARFDPSRFTDRAAEVLRAILHRSRYECATRLPQGGGRRWYSEPVRLARFAANGVNCWKESPWPGLYARLLERREGPAPVVLFDLFFRHESVPAARLDPVIDAASRRILADAGILADSGGQVRSLVRCYPVGGAYFLCDPTREQADFVYIGWDSHLMVDIAAKHCAERRFTRSLDLCTGSGVQGLSLAGRSDEATCADINPRAVAMAEANARLNGLTNVRTVQSDLFSNVPGRFDCVTANTPYVPHPAGGQLPIGGGDIGIEFTMRLLGELPEHLAPDGISIIYTSDPIIRGKRCLVEHVTRAIGHLPLRVTLIPLFTNNYPMTRPMQMHYDRLGLRGYDDCILVIERASRYEVRREHWDWLHYQRTRIDAWLDWRRRRSPAKAP